MGSFVAAAPTDEHGSEKRRTGKFGFSPFSCRKGEPRVRTLLLAYTMPPCLQEKATVFVVAPIRLNASGLKYAAFCVNGFLVVVVVGTS